MKNRSPIMSVLAFAIGLGLCIVFAAGIEIYFRLSSPKDEVQSEKSFYLEADPELIWRLAKIESGPAATNSLGFRDNEPDLKADIRVLLLGDSVSWGDGIKDSSKIYPIQTEAILNRAQNKNRYDIINTGVPGYSTFQELKYLKLKGIKLKPDIIVLQFCLNDVVERYLTISKFGGKDTFFGVDTRSSIPGLMGWLINNSRAIERLARRASKKQHTTTEDEVKKLARKEFAGELEEKWDTVFKELDEVRAIAEKNNIPLLLVITPYAFQLYDPDGSRLPQDILIDYAERNRIAALDLLPIIVKNSGPELPAPFLDQSHFSIPGHGIAAKALADALLELKR